MREKGMLIGRIPFGYRLKEDGIYLDLCEDEQVVVNEMKKLHDQGLSIRNIAREMNERMLFNRGRTNWTKSSIFRILSRKDLPAGRLHIN